MKRIGVLLGILLIVLIPATISFAIWTGVLVVSNNSTTSYTMFPAMITTNVTYLVNNHYITSNGSDTKVQVSASDVPFMLAQDRINFANPLPNNSNVNASFLTGQNTTANFSIITGYGGYVTTNDTASLELSSNWSNPMSVYVTNTDGDIAYKPGAYETRYSYSTSNITSYILGQNTSNQTVSADGFMDTLSFTGATNWQSVQAADGTYVWTSTSGIDFYQVTPSSINATTLTSIDYLTVTYYAKNQNAINPGGIQSYIYLSGSNTTGASRSLTNTSYQLFSDNMSRPGGGSWSYSDLANIQIGIAMSQDTVHIIYCDLIFVDVHYSYRYKSVTATGISTGNMTVTPQYLSNLVSNSSFENGNPPTGWSITGAGGTFNQTASKFQVGTYSTNVTRAGTDTAVYQALSSPASYQGKILTAGAWVWSSVPNTTLIAIEDSAGGTNSAFHPGDSAWHFLTVTRTIDLAAAFVQPLLEVITVDTTSYFDGVIISQASSLPNQYYNFNLSINGVIQGQSAVDGSVSVNDTLNNIVWGSNATPYFNSIKIIIGGTEKLWYQPNTIISGTKLPDRDSTKDGDITWGTNPSGISSTVQSFTPSVSVIPNNTGESSQDVAPTISANETAGKVNPQTAVVPTTPISPLMVFLAGQYAYNLPLFVLWVLVAFVVTTIVFAFSLSLFNHMGLAGFLGSATWGLFIVMVGLPHLYLSLSVLGFLVGLVQENRG